MIPFDPRRRLALLLLPSILCACGSMEPQGALKAVMEGDIFEGAPRDPAEEKRIEDDQRQQDHHIPPSTDKQGAVNFKIPL